MIDNLEQNFNKKLFSLNRNFNKEVHLNQYYYQYIIKQGASSNINIDGIEDGIIFIALEEERFG